MKLVWKPHTAKWGLLNCTVTACIPHTFPPTNLTITFCSVGMFPRIHIRHTLLQHSVICTNTPSSGYVHSFIYLIRLSPHYSSLLRWCLYKFVLRKFHFQNWNLSWTISSWSHVPHNQTFLRCVVMFLFYLQEGVTPLHAACLEGHLLVVECLIAEKADVNHQTKVHPILLITCTLLQ